MKKEIKSVLKKLAGEAPEFHECFKKPFIYGEWIVATDEYSLIRVKKQGNNGGYSPLTKQIDIDRSFPSKTCNCLVDIERLQEKLKSKSDRWKSFVAEWRYRATTLIFPDRRRHRDAYNAGASVGRSARGITF